jgi:glycosyltransferase involved in cell wall biosynthesis
MKTLLIISQTFVPDPASVGQHVADVAFEMARRGHRVRVLASARGYEDPTARYPTRETLHGADVRRIPFASFGKRNLLLRVLGTGSFLLQALLRGLFTPNLGGVFYSTSPPMVGFIATIIHLVRRVPVAYWAMDLNPDQLIALGKLKPTSLAARFLERANRFYLRHAALVIALDRFMADKLRTRANLDGKLLVAPPWPHDAHVEPVEHADNPFRTRHGLGGKFVVMYSGNHSPSNPLTTLLQAAVRLKDDPTLHFAFIGGGTGKREVEAVVAEHRLTNVLNLPYQPMSELRYSLSAADVHLVALGGPMVGIIHPCKVYSAMAAGRPVLFLGPKPSHIADLLDRHSFGVQVAHGDVSGAVSALRHFQSRSRDELSEMGRAAQTVLRDSLSQSILCRQLCDRLEDALRLNRSDEAHTHPQPTGQGPAFAAPGATRTGS